ncbi:protein of unknown function [Methylacidimicrobium sp. AP8]|nr:protein of unknown function [Methylacidimicrobium sp. AP8]
MRRIPLRWKLALLSGVTVGLALALAGAVGGEALYRRLVQEADFQIDSDAQEILSALRRDESRAPGKLPEGLESEESSIWEVASPGGASCIGPPSSDLECRSE